MAAKEQKDAHINTSKSFSMGGKNTTFKSDANPDPANLQLNAVRPGSISPASDTQSASMMHLLQEILRTQPEFGTKLLQASQQLLQQQENDVAAT